MVVVMVVVMGQEMLQLAGNFFPKNHKILEPSFHTDECSTNLPNTSSRISSCIVNSFMKLGKNCFTVYKLPFIRKLYQILMLIQCCMFIFDMNAYY